MKLFSHNIKDKLKEMESLTIIKDIDFEIGQIKWIERGGQ